MWGRIGQDVFFLKSRREGGWWPPARNWLVRGLEASGRDGGDLHWWLGSGRPRATPPSLPPRARAGPRVMPFVLAQGLGAVVLSEECVAIKRAH